MFHFAEKVNNTFLSRILADLRGFARICADLRGFLLKSAQIRQNPQQKSYVLLKLLYQCGLCDVEAVPKIFHDCPPTAFLKQHNTVFKMLQRLPLEHFYPKSLIFAPRTAIN